LEEVKGRGEYGAVYSAKNKKKKDFGDRSELEKGGEVV